MEGLAANHQFGGSRFIFIECSPKSGDLKTLNRRLLGLPYCIGDTLLQSPVRPHRRVVNNYITGVCDD